mmetsp:Transcript_45248/g.107524  ORF Transcript_45248/g.107524 Transcript_45248/m.107524 type:complete len:227 (+) Transcript_45248:596-1276(+)
MSRSSSSSPATHSGSGATWGSTVSTSASTRTFTVGLSTRRSWRGARSRNLSSPRRATYCQAQRTTSSAHGSRAARRLWFFPGVSRLLEKCRRKMAKTWWSSPNCFHPEKSGSCFLMTGEVPGALAPPLVPRRCTLSASQLRRRFPATWGNGRCGTLARRSGTPIRASGSSRWAEALKFRKRPAHAGLMYKGLHSAALTLRSSRLLSVAFLTSGQESRMSLQRALEV